MNGWSFDAEWQKKKADEEYLADCREIQKAAAKTAAVEQVRINSAVIKQNLREQERERKKAVGERLELLSNGELQIVSENLAIEPIPRKATNMRWPTLFVLKRAVDESEQIYCIACEIGNQKKFVFLEKNASGNGSYLLRKFASSGIYFKMDTAKAKSFAIQLLGILLSTTETEEVLLPDMAGWMKNPDGTFKFIQEGELTWEKAKKLSK